MGKGKKRTQVASTNQSQRPSPHKPIALKIVSPALDALTCDATDHHATSYPRKEPEQQHPRVHHEQPIQPRKASAADTPKIVIEDPPQQRQKLTLYAGAAAREGRYASKRDSKGFMSFGDALVVIDDEEHNNPNKCHDQGAKEWKSRKINLQEPALDSISHTSRDLPIHGQRSFNDNGIQNLNHSGYRRPLRERHLVQPEPLRLFAPRPPFIPHQSVARPTLSGPTSTLPFPSDGATQIQKQVPQFRNPIETRAFLSDAGGIQPAFSRHPLPLANQQANHPGYTRYLNTDYLRYLELGQASFLGEVVFRIHTSSSASPLLWTGDLATSGFSATSSIFRHITPHSYKALFDSYENSGLRPTGDGGVYAEAKWLRQPLMRELMIDHILCRPSKKLITYPKSGPVRMNIQEYHDQQEGYWISTTQSTDWAIFEIARLLANQHLTGKGENKVQLAVIKVHPASRSTSSSSMPGPYGRFGWNENSGGMERRVNPSACLGHYEKSIISPSKLQASIEARRRSSKSFEMLYWGKIFGETIEENLIFTAHYLPFKLPAKFWKYGTQPSSRSSATLPGWLGRLRWDPSKDDWPTARSQLRQNLYPTTKWMAQPVHAWGSTWPPVPIPKAAPDQGRNGDKVSMSDNDASLLVISEDEYEETDRIGSSRKRHNGTDTPMLLVDLMK
ncbi:uncharacterized protein I303_104581 [Kwoniella dejecticola CBS 10117]|uniref:Uncharacterized protein n=1 Tax=Kwoniella dejecticola CBS 10117 TaxID=1296121 RepID=A0A1A6A4X1_9TREE|nr:uncharacterized protein I303_04442 [Kwoniella dejecticola CBS 10117]OBR85111.1 hypothetical protein I303_04442 [Kwoniella dejecticola CBS 10117]